MMGLLFYHWQIYYLTKSGILVVLCKRSESVFGEFLSQCSGEHDEDLVGAWGVWDQGASEGGALTDGGG